MRRCLCVRLIFVSQQKRLIPLDVRYDLMSAFVKKRRGFPVLPESEAEVSSPKDSMSAFRASDLGKSPQDRTRLCLFEVSLTSVPLKQRPLRQKSSLCSPLPV